jgi:hypothetical protein
MTEAANKRTSGNGAVAFRFHALRLSCAVPECKRSCAQGKIKQDSSEWV